MFLLIDLYNNYIYIWFVSVNINERFLRWETENIFYFLIRIRCDIPKVMVRYIVFLDLL